MLVDYSFQDYDLTYGRFGIGQLFPSHGMGYVFGRTAQGERLEISALQMMNKLAKGEGLPSFGSTAEDLYAKCEEIGRSGPTMKEIRREQQREQKQQQKQKQKRP